MKNTLKTLFLTIIMTSSLLQASEIAGVYYSIQANKSGDAYQITAQANQTPTADVSLTGQVTLKVPHHQSNDQAFNAINIVSHIEGVQWIESSRVNAPEEAPDSDYISFSFISVGGSPNVFQWKQKESKALFSFQNANNCLGAISIMDNNDPFNHLPNSANTNPGNQFTNLGWGNLSRNHYLGNKGTAASCL